VAGTIFLDSRRSWPVASWAFRWVAEFLADRIEDEQAVDYLRRVIDSNMGILGLEESGDFSPAVRRQILHLLREDLVPDARVRLPSENFDREAALEILGQLANMAREVSN
jgi:hypothetical protein